MIAIVVFELWKVSRALLHSMCEDGFACFMTRIAVCRQRRELALRVVTHEALRVSERARLAVWFFGLMAVGAIHTLVLVMCERDVKL